MGRRKPRWNYILFTLLAALTCCTMADAQELNCAVEINTGSIEGTNRSIFETLQESVRTYLNDTKFSEAIFAPDERIECRLFITVKECGGNNIKADIQVQQTRPVFNSSYSTTLFNYRDSDVEFEYREGEPLVYNENSWSGNLTALLDFYAYLIIGLDSDSFSPKGGDEYFAKAQSVVQMAQSNGESGWRSVGTQRSRGLLVNTLTDAKSEPMRNLYYDYHRKGLDEMAGSPEKGRKSVTEALGYLSSIYSRDPMSMSLAIFHDAKLDELTGIYSKAPEGERKKVYDILSQIYPTDLQLLDRILHPDL